MDDLFKNEPERKGFNPLFLVGILAGLALIAAAVWLLARKPSMGEQVAQISETASREGSADFADLSKDIIISTDPNTVQSPTGLGTISMYITGKIRNKGTRTITVLEISVSVVTQFNEPLRERKILVVPVQKSAIAAGETIPVTLTLDGFSKDDDRANIRWKVTAVKAQ